MRNAYHVPEPCLCGDTECGRCFPFAEKCLENAAEEALERLEQEVDRVLDEIDAGEHDSDLIDSPLIDCATVMKIAREQAMNLNRTFRHECDVGAIVNLRLQIHEYAKDVAERRLL